MSKNGMPERVLLEFDAYGDNYCGVEYGTEYAKSFLRRVTEYIRADVAAAQLAERDARIAELEAAQHEATSFFLTPHGEWLWGEKETPLVERIKAMAFEMDAKIAELEADLDAISKAFRLHTRPPTTGT